ncbi:hypothetical protein KJ708_08435, partial [bacterium]|nr:hypothetical protein [bacterium]
NIIGSPNPITNQRTIKRLVKAGILSPVKRGLYVTDSFDLWQLSRHIINNAYISLDSILAKNMLIGTLPQNRLSLVSTNKNLVIRFKNYRIDIYSLSDDLFFGFTQNNQGLNLADSEKAYLDMLYYHLRGYKFAIDPRNEINIQKLNKTKIRSYLIKYKNPKFVTFVKGLING